MHPTGEISLGEFVLTGGELLTLSIIDALNSLVPGVLENYPLSDVDKNLLE